MVNTPLLEFKQVQAPIKQVEVPVLKNTMAEPQKLETTIVEPARGKFKNYISDFIKKLKEMRTKEV